MKAINSLFAGAIAAAAFLPTTAHALDTVQFVGVGSSAQFNAFALGAHTWSGASNSWTFKNGGSVTDAGTGVVQTGNIWIVWDGAAAGSRKIAVGLSVDSIVGNRAFFNSNTVKVTQAALTAGQNLVTGLTDTALPADVHDAVAGVSPYTLPVVNVGLSDITAADAKVQSDHVIALGYNTTTNPVKDSNASSVFPVNFNLSSRTYQTNAVGAAPVVVFVNKTQTGSGHLGAATVKNIDRFTLAGFLNGLFGAVVDIDTTLAKPTIRTSGFGKPGTSSTQVVSFVREPLSGTYTTIEDDIVASAEVNSTQELNVSTNPLNETTPVYSFASPNPVGGYTIGGRVRAIGTGALVTAVGATNDSLGYSFWSFGNFNGVRATTKYLTVDGVDPFAASPTTFNNAYPAAGSLLTFPTIANGSYPIWSLLRAITDTTPNTDVTTIIADATAADSSGDYLPFNSLKVFREHRATPQVASPANGIIPSLPEAGADAGGAVQTINSDIDFWNQTGTELLGDRQ